MTDKLELNSVMDQNNSGRFQVARASVDFAEAPVVNVVPPVDVNGEAGSNSSQGRQSTQYDTRYLRSLRHYLTRDALPRESHYRNLGSIAENQLRPTLEQLREEGKLPVVDEADVEAKKNVELKGKVVKFGWIDGVYMRCLLNIWGVMLFLRLTWVVGQAGLLEALAIICLANCVTIITSISMSAVATNGQIKGGGIYYMISRSLGPEFGASIGLLFTLSNAVSCAMYVVGFCESLNAMLKEYGGHRIVDGAVNDIRIVGVVTMVVILLLAIVGMEWVTRVQVLLLGLLVVAQFNFLVGCAIGPQNTAEIARGFSGISIELLTKNLWSDYQSYQGVSYDFFKVFAVFFPAVTGIVAGANLSGDLKDPASAIPKGTLLAIFTTFLTYVVYPILIAAGAQRYATGNSSDLAAAYNCTGEHCKYGTLHDEQVMGLMSAWAPLIYAGTFAATLSSAIASLVGAPRVLQALSKDKLYPYISIFAVGKGANNDPMYGYALVFIISVCCVLIGELNAIANLSSEVFLAAYALINLSCFHASFLKSPGWRPTFKYYKSWVSLIGALACVAVMFLSDAIVATVVMMATFLLYLYVSYRKPDVNWGSSTQAQTYVSALNFMQRLSRVKDHVKTYRPQILVLTGVPSSRPMLVDFAYSITKSSSLLIAGQVIKGPSNMRAKSALQQQAYSWLARHQIRGFYAVVEDDNFSHGACSLMLLAGLGNMQPNVLLMGYKADWASCSRNELVNYFDCVQEALNNSIGAAVLRVPDGLDCSSLYMSDSSPTTVNATGQALDGAVLQRTESVDQDDVLPSDDSAPDTPQLERNVEATPTTAQNGANGTKANGRAANTLAKFMKSKKSNVQFTDAKGEPLSPAVIDRLQMFRKKQTGTIDVWWLYDDGGLTLLLPYLLTTRSQWNGCKLRVFTMANRRDELDTEKRRMAALIAKFRIDYSDVIVIEDVHKPAEKSTRAEFDQLIEQFRVGDSSNETADEECSISESELLANKDKTNRQLRLHELVQQHSKQAALVIMTLPVPRKGTIHAPLFMAWMEMVSKNMPPFLLVRGNQTSVLTFYS